MMFDCDLQNIFRLKNGQSRSINWENRNGEKGKGGMASSDLGPSRKGSPCIPKIEAGETVTLGEIQGEGMIQHIWITVTDRTSERSRYVLRDLVLRMYWDDEEFPSVECPLGDFFCCGFGVSYQVNSVPIAVNPTRGFNSYFPMPFRKNARITIENQCDEPIPAFFYQIDYCLTTVPEDAAYFHAQWRRQRITEKAKDYVVLDNIKGKGQYVGTYLALTSLERYWYGEGEMKFICKTSARPAQYRNFDIFQCFNNIGTHSVHVRNIGIFSYIESFINTSSQMLRKLSLDFLIDF